MDNKIKKIEVKENKVVSTTDERRRGVVEDAIKIVEKFFDGRKTSFTIAFIKKREEMNKVHSLYVGREVTTEDWVCGGVYGDNTLYIIDVDVFEKITCYKKEVFFPTLVHEMVHIFLKNLFNIHLPMWLEEGIAYFVAGQIKDRKPSLDEDLEKAHTEQEWLKTHPYISSGLFVRHLIDTFGKKKLFDLLGKLDFMESREGFAYKFNEVFQSNFSIELNNFLERLRCF